VKRPLGAEGPQKLLRLKEVEELVGLTESSIYRLMKRGAFPSQVAAGGRSVAWVEDRVLEWLAARPPRRRRAPAEPVVSIVPEGEPSASMVRALLEKSGHTVASAAEALDISRRTMERFVAEGPRWQRPRPVILAALNVLSPPPHVRAQRLRAASWGLA